MKKLTKINLAKLYKDDMAGREMNMLRGGNNCGCYCGDSISREYNYSTNWSSNTVAGNSNYCSWEGSGTVTVYGGNIVP